MSNIPEEMIDKFYKVGKNCTLCGESVLDLSKRELIAAIGASETQHQDTKRVLGMSPFNQREA